MTVRCVKCGKTFAKKVDHTKNIPHVPNVCSSTCFIEHIVDDEDRQVAGVAIAALPYEGVVSYRSMYEHALAEWFKAQGIAYEYEHYRARTSPKAWYIPDFYLPDHYLFIEVKGVWELAAYRKFREFQALGYDICLADLAFINRIGGRIDKYGYSENSYYIRAGEEGVGQLRTVDGEFAFGESPGQGPRTEEGALSGTDRDV